MALVPASVLAFFKSPNIHLKILQTELYTFLHRILSWENSIVKDQDIFSFGNHFINSHNLFSDTACNILRRKLMLRPRASFFFMKSHQKKGKKERFIKKINKRLVTFSNSPAFKLHFQGSVIFFQKCASNSMIRAQRCGLKSKSDLRMFISGSRFPSES